MFDSTYIIAKRQFMKAQELLNKPVDHQLKLKGSVQSVFQWIDMTKQEVSLSRVAGEGGHFKRTVKTCPAAMGYSFAAGTTERSCETCAGTEPTFWQPLGVGSARACKWLWLWHWL